MVIFPLAPDQIIAQMWSNGARGGEAYPAETRGTGLPHGENFIILTLTVFLWSTRLTERLTDWQTDGRTNGRAIAYSALHIYAICCRALKIWKQVKLLRRYEKSEDGTKSPWYEWYDKSKDRTKNPWYESSMVRKVWFPLILNVLPFGYTSATLRYPLFPAPLWFLWFYLTSMPLQWNH